MKKFKFRLQRVLEHKDTLKEEARREVTIRNRAVAEARQKLEKLQSSFDSNLLEDGAMPASMVMMNALFASRLRNEMAEQVIAIEKAEREAEEARAAYIEAAKEARTLHMLRDKRLEQYNQYIQKEEAKFLDELTVQKGNTVRQDFDEVPSVD